MTPEAAATRPDEDAAAAEDDSARVAQRRTRLALATMLVLLIALGAGSVVAANRIYTTAQNRYVDEAFPLRNSARDLLLQMVNEETGVRGFMISGKRVSLTPYMSGRPAVAQQLAALQQLTIRRPEIAQQVAMLRTVVASLQTYFRREIVLVRSGLAGQRRAQANVLGGQARFDRFRAAADSLLAHSDQIVAEAERAQHRTLRRTLAFVLALAGAAAAIGALLLALLPSRLSQLYRREQAARRAAERGDRASRSLAHVRDAVVLLDERGVVRYWNPAAAAELTIEEDDALDRPLHEIVPELPAIESALADGGGSSVFPLPRRGAERWFAINESRFPGGRVLVLRNVTEAQQLERTRSEFLATASHELRTPLAAVYGAVRTLRRDDRPFDRVLESRLLQMIEEESESLSAIVDQIIVSAQLDRSELRLDRRPVDLREVAASVLASAELRTEEHDLVLDAPASVSTVCDPARLRQVVVNLVDNAIKYSPAGGQVVVRVRRDGRHATLAVEDEGIGIPAESQARVFDKFFRLDPDMLAGIGGSGLGLYISRELVEQMGGRLTVASRAGAGSTFTIVLSAS